MKRTAWQRPWVRTVTTLLTAAVMLMIFCFSMENADNSDRRSGTISLCIIRVFHPDYDQMDHDQQQSVYDDTQHVVRKCAHFTEYMMLGFLLRLSLESWFGYRMKKYRTLSVTGFATGVLYACSDELHQLAIDGRSGQWTDVFVDSFGVLTGIILGILLIKYLNRKNEDCSGGRHQGSDGYGILQEQ